MKKLFFNFLFNFLFTLSFFGCYEVKEDKSQAKVKEIIQIPDSADTMPIGNLEPTYGALEQKLRGAGLVNIQEVDATILVDLKYSSMDNFSGIDLYEVLEHCYLQQKPAEMLAMAQKLLKKKRPDYSLLVYDGARPLHIQQKLWDTLDMPILEKKSYVADPKIGSIHNYGSAVDVTIALGNGIPIDMGTPYDFFGALAHPAKESEMLQKGLLNKQQIENRELLREVMMKAGFTPIKYEWWHFNAVSRARAQEIYKIIE